MHRASNRSVFLLAQHLIGSSVVDDRELKALLRGTNDSDWGRCLIMR